MMTTDKVLALALAREAGGLTDIRTSLNVDGDSIVFTPEELDKFAALIQQQMEAENVCICGYTYAQHTYDKSCDSHGVCPDRQGVFRNERQHELIQKLDAENAELRKDAERYRWLVDNKFHHMAHPNGDGWGISDLIYGDDIDYAIDRARSAK